MASASGVLSDSEKKSNFTKLSRLLIDAGTPSLRQVLDNIHPPGTGPGTLADFLASNKTTVEAKLYSNNPRKKKRLSKVQWETLYPPSGLSSSSKDFDISLLFTLLREWSICGLTAPHTGWDALPNPADCSLQANLASIKYYRNEIYGHIKTTEVEETDFERYWNDLSKAISSFGVVSQNEIDNLKSSPLEKDYIELLEQWCRCDCDIAAKIEAQIAGLSSKFETQMAIQSAQIADLKTEMVEQLAEIKQNKAPELDIHVDCIGATPNFTDDDRVRKEHLKMYMHTIVDAYLDKVTTIQEEHQLLRRLIDIGIVHLHSTETNSLCITVRCLTLDSLHSLWYEYTSGHLNKTAEKYLVTQEILDKYQLTSVQLRTTIHEEEYRKCLDFFGRSKGTEYRTEELVIPTARGYQQEDAAGDSKSDLEHQKEDVDVPTSKIGEKREGGLYGDTGHYREVIESQTIALKIARETGDKSGECTACEKLGNAYQSLGNYIKAEEYHAKQLDIAIAIGDKSGEGRAYYNLGNDYQSLGDYKRALEYHTKQLDIARVIRDERGEGIAYDNLGNVYQSLGNYERALEYHTKQLDIARVIRDERGEGIAYDNLGNVYQSLGNYERALEYHTKQLDIARVIDDMSGEGRAYDNLGNDYQLLGDYTRALDYHTKQLYIARVIGDERGEGRACGNLGLVCYSLGYIDQVIKYHQKFLSIAQNIGGGKSEFDAYVHFGITKSSLRDYLYKIKLHKKA